MRRTWVFAVPLFLSFLLTGCPFESKTPIGDPLVGSLDSRLLGAWSWTDSTSGSVTQFEVLRFNSSEYYVEAREEGKEIERYRMYIVTVGGQQFLSINDLRDDDGASSFLLGRYSVSEAGVLSIRFVGEKAIPKSLASSRQALIDFLAAHLDGTVLDDPDGPMLLYRSTPDGMPRTGDAKHDR
jgi:hypothetical protein